jgi:hypothetical protein
MSIETTRPFLDGLAERRSRVERFLVAAHELRLMPVEDRIEVIEDVVAFLAETLLPHAEAAQRVLYPAAEGRFARRGSAASISFDREEIRRHIAELADCDPRRTGRLQELLYALYVVASNHVQTEEEVYLRLLDREPERMARVMDEIAERETV